ncbi:MAG: hypothetical protein KKD01_01845 [Proteobacteria bacterium]|nr:hypothetical protein [Pseudomonadota bacterium]MBU1419652.1 hypothetical protein [Pseudomonadota bacterium]MBU1453443.1 hypothetical protein [Pseudomonadota bacterium]
METFLDVVWENLYAALLFLAESMDHLLSPIHTVIGPMAVIFLLALATVVTTKFLGRVCRTKRHILLEQKFNYWLSVREEAMQCEDRDKGKRMARNIDQATLNRSYYDYFFEGLLLSLLTMYMPILLVLSYVNTAYRSERLMALTGKEYLIRFNSSGSDPTLIGSVFFFFVSLLSLYLGWFILKNIFARMKRNKAMNEEKQTPTTHSPVNPKRFFLAEELK